MNDRNRSDTNLDNKCDKCLKVSFSLPLKVNEIQKVTL